MFNFYINNLIENLHNLKEERLPSSCLFFADDGNLHGTIRAQIHLNSCAKWSKDHEIVFASEKCLVLAKRTRLLVPKNIKQSSTLKGKSVEAANPTRNIIIWKLGRIAYLQNCMNCGGAFELSRKHALECTFMYMNG
jgi:hypothetical protein